jgi:hypothetical protein
MKRLVLAALVASVLAAPATAVPTVTADVMVEADATDGCVLVAVRQDSLTGGPNTWVGVLVLAAPFIGPPTPWCEVTIDGVQWGRTDPLVPTPPLAVGASEVILDAPDGASVQVCSHRGVVVCEDVTTAQLPPQAVYDVLNSLLFVLGVDAVLCPILGSLAPGVPDLLDIDPSGDVALFGSRIWDCPPYDD